MPVRGENKRVSCSKCKPPSIQTRKSDEWKCEACGLEFKLDKNSRTWWPKEWWDFKEERDAEIAKLDQLIALDQKAAASQIPTQTAEEQ